MKKGEFGTETLECGCRLSGVRGEPNSMQRRACRDHTASGACIPCRDGQSHLVCVTCGLSDGRHASWCSDNQSPPVVRAEG